MKRPEPAVVEVLRDFVRLLDDLLVEDEAERVVRFRRSVWEFSPQSHGQVFADELEALVDRAHAALAALGEDPPGWNQ